MATYVNDLRLKEIGTGESSGTWGTETNTNLELIGEALGFGTEGITTNADTHTTTVADGSTDPGRAMYLKYTGTLDSACTITIGPNTMSRMQFIENGTSGSQNIIISQGTGANVTIPAGDTKAVYLDGAGSGAAVVDAFASLNTVDLKVEDDLTVTDDASIGGDATITGTLGVSGLLTANANVTLAGTTPTLTIGDAGAEDTKIVFDGNAQDFYIALDDSADDLLIGLGSTVGTTPAIAIDENLLTTLHGGLTLVGTTPTLTIGDAGAEDTKIVFDGNAQDFYIGLDDSADDLIIGKGSTVGTTPAISIDENVNSTFAGTVNGLTLASGSITGSSSANFALNTANSFRINIDSNDSATDQLFVVGHNRTDVGTTSALLVVRESGLTQVGTASSVYTLASRLVVGDGDDNDGITIQSGTTHQGNLAFNKGDGTTAFGRISYQQDTNFMAFLVNNSEKLRITSAGVLSIGDTTPESGDASAPTSLFLQGGEANMIIKNTDATSSSQRQGIAFLNSSGTRVGTITITSSATGYATSSDYRLKENVKTLPNGLDRLNSLKPVQFNWKTDGATSEGFLAHEVKAVFPYAVKGEKDAEEMQSMDYGRITPLLVKAIQDHQEQIEQLKTEINKLH